MKLKKVDQPRVQNLSTLESYCDIMSRAQKLLASKIPEQVRDASVLFRNLLIMDMDRCGRICFDLSRCEAILGNVSEAMVFLSKATTPGYIDASLIEENPDFESLRSVEAYNSLIKCLKISRPSVRLYFSKVASS